MQNGHKGIVRASKSIVNISQCLPIAGHTALVPGDPVGAGLSSEAAKDLGLCVGTAVGTGIIDAHAGGLGEVYVR